MTTVWIYVDTKYHAGHPDHLKVFANAVAADEWFRENDPDGKTKLGHCQNRLRPLRLKIGQYPILQGKAAD